MNWTGSQWVAVGGIVIFGALALFAVIAISPERRGDPTINSTERAEELSKQGKREQIITYTTGMTPLDHNRNEPASLYVIGVSQFTLGEAEQIVPSRYQPRGSYRGFNGNPSWRPESDGLPDNYSVYGPFNNLLIYDAQSGGSERVFETRIAISEFVVLGDINPPLLAIFAASVDSNRDDRLDEEDLQQLYIFTPSGRSLHKVEILGASAENIVRARGKGFLVVQAAIDKNKDGLITSRSEGKQEIEPRYLYRVDLTSFVATPLVPEELTRSLQETLDGAANTPGTR
jgi:hypothetical protein